MKRYLIAVLLTFTALTMMAQEPLTLDSCFALAKANNVTIKTNKLEIEKAKEVKAQVFTKFFPQVSLNMLSYYAINPIIEYGLNDINQEGEFGEFVVAVIEALQDLGADIPTDFST